jgi:hypothetical protein
MYTVLKIAILSCIITFSRSREFIFVILLDFFTGKFKQRWSKMTPVLTKWTTTSHFKQLNIRETSAFLYFVPTIKLCKTTFGIKILSISWQHCHYDGYNAIEIERKLFFPIINIRFTFYNDAIISTQPFQIHWLVVEKYLWIVWINKWYSDMLMGDCLDYQKKKSMHLKWRG